MTGFDRVRRRDPDATPGRVPGSAGLPDAEGKRALFSRTTETPARGTVTVECSRCGQTSVLSASRGARLLASPGVHLPVLRRDHPSFVRCPSCRRRSWVKLTLRLT